MSFRSKSKDKAQNVSFAQQREMMGPNLSFAGTEAYNLLRTNLNMTVTSDKECPIIGVTSSVPGEGKSTTAVNLAYAMVEDGKRVLLIEADMRLPSISARLGVKLEPGLSNLLVGDKTEAEVLQHTTLHKNLYVMSAGTIPPNPSELLGSDRMEKAMKVYSKIFDYIILDMPPVNMVSDALIVSRIATGMILVIRRGYCHKRDLREALRQIDILGVKVLGFVMTHAKTHSKKYGGRYGYGYGYGENKKAKKESKASEQG